jgi:hypothetical protein
VKNFRYELSIESQGASFYDSRAQDLTLSLFVSEWGVIRVLYANNPLRERAALG